MFDSKKIIFKIILLISIITTILIILQLIFSSPAKAYELSIYSQYPVYFWGFVITSLLTSSLIIILSESKIHIRSCFGIIIFVNILIIALPIFRGYFIHSRGDVLTHLGLVQNLIDKGTFHDQTFYPGLYIFVSNINHLSKIPPRAIFKMLPIIFYIFFVISIYVFFRKGFDNSQYKYPVLLGIFIGTQFTHPIPNIFAFLFLPIVLFLLKKPDWGGVRLYILLSILLFSTIFIHPLSSLYLLVILLFYSLYLYVNSKLPLYQNNITENGMIYISLSLIAIWFYWYTIFPKIQRNIKKSLLSLLFYSDLNPALEHYTRALNVYNVKFFDALQIVTFRFGISLLTFLVSIMVILVFLIEKRKNLMGNLFDQYQTGFFIGCFIIFVSWSGLNSLTHFVTFSRVFKWFIIFSIFIIGMLMNQSVLKRKNQVKIFTIIIAIILIISTFGLFSSPISKRANRQLPLSEYKGSKWFLENNAGNSYIWEFGTSQRRMGHLIHGRYSVPDKNIVEYNVPQNKNVSGLKYQDMPEHFGYDNHKQIGNNFSGYIVHTDLTKQLFQEVFSEYKEYWFFNKTSYNKLNDDPSVDRIYDNGFYYTYKVRKIETK